MAWTPFHDAMPDHPKTEMLALSLEVSIPQAVGHVAMAWAFALRYAPDGDLTKYPAALLAKKCGWNGDPEHFIEAMDEAGWFDVTEGEIHLHDWTEYGGKVEDKRRQDADRKRKERGQDKVSDGRPSDVTRKSIARKEEKRVEENTPHAPQGGEGDIPFSEPLEGPSEDEVPDLRAPEPAWKKDKAFLSFWEAYPACSRKKAAARAHERWQRLKIPRASLADLLARLEEDKASPDWVKEAGAFIPAPEVWLNKKRWLDEPVPGAVVVHVTPQADPDEPAWFAKWMDGGREMPEYLWAWNRVNLYGMRYGLTFREYEVKDMCQEIGIRRTFEHYRPLILEAAKQQRLQQKEA